MMSEVMLSQFRGHEIVDGIACQGKIDTIRVHLAVLEQASFEVPVDEVVVKLQHAQFGVLQDEKSHVDGQGVRHGSFVHLYFCDCHCDDNSHC